MMRAFPRQSWFVWVAVAVCGSLGSIVVQWAALASLLCKQSTNSEVAVGLWGRFPRSSCGAGGGIWTVHYQLDSGHSETDKSVVVETCLFVVVCILWASLWTEYGDSRRFPQIDVGNMGWGKAPISVAKMLRFGFILGWTLHDRSDCMSWRACQAAEGLESFLRQSTCFDSVRVRCTIFSKCKPGLLISYVSNVDFIVPGCCVFRLWHNGTLVT